MYSESLTKEIEKIIKEEGLECSIDTFENKFNSWKFISKSRKLSESFIEKFQDKVNWEYISWYQNLSEEFIEKFQHKVDWVYISQCQHLSEEFIEKFQNKVRWENISYYQKLSESFIEKFQYKVDWFSISIFQRLSESFIEKFQNKIYWCGISTYQKLSEPFIKKFKDKVNWGQISWYQKLSPQLREDYKINKSNWLYKPVNFKLKYIKTHTNYEVIDDKYIIAYKGIRSDNYSKMNFQYKYEVGKTYEAHCDCNVNEENSFGLSAWDIKKAKKYCDEKIIKVKIAIKDIGCIVKKSNKIRCFKFEVLEEVKDN